MNKFSLIAIGGNCIFYLTSKGSYLVIENGLSKDVTVVWSEGNLVAQKSHEKIDHKMLWLEAALAWYWLTAGHYGCAKIALFLRQVKRFMGGHFGLSRFDQANFVGGS